MSRFHRHIGIDYSGAETPEASLKGLRVYQCQGGGPTEEVPPPPGPKKYWTRRGIAEWLVQELDGSVPTIVGIDHGFSFPMRYFERHGIAPDWDAFLDDFCAHWPTDGRNTYVDFVRDGIAGNGAARMGNSRWRRLTDEACGAKSVFHFDVQGTVAKSTHAGLPWLRHIRRAHPAVVFWPFDGWSPPPGASVIVETYPRLYSDRYPREDRSPDQHDAFATAKWLRDADRDGTLDAAFVPPAPEPVAMTARVEGWIFGASQATPKPTRKSGTAKAPTTRPGTVNRNGQQVITRTDTPGTDHNQVVYILHCQSCGARYGANGSDLHHRRCPHCDGGRPGLPI